MRVLIAEDEHKLASLLKRGLEREGMSVDVIGDGKDALWRAQATEYDAILLDVMLPGLDGFKVCRQLREAGVWSPVLMLTARDAVSDRVAGLDSGADDYLTKPFSYAELLARLRALMRRGKPERPTDLVVGELRLDPARHRVWRGDAEIELSPKEMAVLETLMRRPGQVLSRFELLEHAWDYEYENRSNVVDSYVRFLRAKVDKPFGVKSIETVRGAGYRLREDGGHRVMARLPIRVRVTITFAIAMALVLAAFGLFLYLRHEAQLDESVNDSLEVRFGDLTALVREESGSDNGLVFRTLDPEDTFAQVLASDGSTILTTTGFDGESVFSPSELAQAETSTTEFERQELGELDGRVRLLAGPIDVDGQAGVAVVGLSLEDRDASLHQLALMLLLGGPAALALATLAGYWAAGRALGPVERMRQEAAAITAEAPGGRLAVPVADDQLRRLANTLNQMLARLEGAIERERQFVDDASHELRTPLALHKTELELAQRYASNEGELRKAIASGIEEVNRLAQLADDLLVAARSGENGLALNLEELDGGDLLETVATRFRSRVSSAGRWLEIEAGDAISIRGDRLRLEQALTNMVENALRHGAGRIELAAIRERNAIRLHVRDEGAGFEDDFREHAFERFSRGDAARGRGGAGLGLAIVATIAEAHGGCAGVETSQSAGADVWIELPVASVAA